MLSGRKQDISIYITVGGKKPQAQPTNPSGAVVSDDVNYTLNRLNIYCFQ